MVYNPWLVDSIQAFYFIRCPECSFETQNDEEFQDHAIESHPSCFVLFGKSEGSFQRMLLSSDPQNGTGLAFEFWNKICPPNSH